LQLLDFVFDLLLSPLSFEEDIVQVAVFVLPFVDDLFETEVLVSFVLGHVFD
jgi:hypothetical protein